MMLLGRARLIALLALAVYTIVMLYFLYIGFGRSMSLGAGGFNLIPSTIPLSLPINGVTWYWFYNTANFLAFIPYGFIIPLLVKVRFPKIIGVFLLVITTLELIQWATGLGSFDAEDILTNGLGVTIGYVAQVIGRGKLPLRLVTFSRIIVISVALAVTTITIVHLFHVAYAKVTQVEPGEAFGLHERTPMTESFAWETGEAPFTIRGGEVDVTTNYVLVDSEQPDRVTYQLNRNYYSLTGFIGVPDDFPISEVEVEISLNDGEAGADLYLLSNMTPGPNSFEMPLREADTLTITVHRNDATSTILLWDFILTEKK
ncbi:VanZ family protein [Paenalkalicoccus suaedae]|uniref:VanZ family protein n=1 Tax=Paenalkalicoccus suaedae TaxID=2592382 RepID=A0A859FCJ3_9BACI|nr:VanZ family protein [Paenalkalicoccus suaedae]QKS70482.1 VanZ family protein [Paenalkalicoccus suaedae]